MPTYHIMYGGSRYITADSPDEAYVQFWRWLREQADAGNVGLIVEEEEAAKEEHIKLSDGRQNCHEWDWTDSTREEGHMATEKMHVELYDEECWVEDGFVETASDGTRRYTCELSMVAYLKDGTELKGKVLAAELVPTGLVEPGDQQGKESQ